MTYKIDTQTINDLRIVVKSGGDDIYSFFNKTLTQGGASALNNMFLNPFSNESDIRTRKNCIRYFTESQFQFSFNVKLFGSISYYLSNCDERTRISKKHTTTGQKLEYKLGLDQEYRKLKKGVLNTLTFLYELKEFWKEIQPSEGDRYKIEELHRINEILSMQEFHVVTSLKKRPKNLSFSKIAYFDELFRFTVNAELMILIQHVDKVDAFISVAKVARENKLAFAEIEEDRENCIELDQAYHPLIANAIANTIEVDENSNMIFLTGANMAGKSTFLKTFGIAVYLAHMGFPVPAKSMRFSVQNGMMTTINLSDNLGMGLSHFYAEVKRVKEVIERINGNERITVVFDELFRGTNVKDAYDATIAVADIFSQVKNCIFIISTHIIEVGDVLKEKRENIKFKYLPTIMKDNIPHYPYKIKDGITDDRHGMLIINNEGVFDILNT
ncbi:MutS-related protein [Marinifilum sp.]|uniref:MutS-related protein n=1 Tax=Marinifilum sp. TaxID=2033137 RepID=UPI003BAB9C25